MCNGPVLALLLSVSEDNDVEGELDCLYLCEREESECSEKLEDAVGLETGEWLDIASIFKVSVSVSKRQQKEQRKPQVSFMFVKFVILDIRYVNILYI